MTNVEFDRDYLKTDRLQKYIYLYISANRYIGMLARTGRSDATLTSYTSTMRTLIQAIGSLKGEDARLEDLTEEDIFGIMRIIGGRERTLRWRFIIFGQWVEFQTGSNSIRSMRILWNAEEPDRTFITLDEYKRILSLTRSDTERLIVCLGAQMGLRMHEIAAIRIADISDGQLIVSGKGHGRGKVVRMRIPESLQRMIADYLRNERRRILSETGEPDVGILLLNRNGRERGAIMTPSAITRVYQRISDDLGYRVTSHVMRRLYCTVLADEGGLRSDLDTLRRMMRHERIGTTLSCYLNADPDRMNEAQSKLEAAFGVGN